VNLRHLTALFLLGAAVHFSAGTGVAQGSAANPAATDPASATPSEGIKAFLERTVKFQGSVRARWEGGYGSDFALTPADSYGLTRIRLGVAFQPTSFLRLYGEGQDARAEFYKTVPSSSYVDPFDFRQGYVEVGAIEGNGVKLRAGRQDMVLGSGRLLSTGDWSNVTKTFDIVRAYVTTKPVNLSLTAGSPLLYDPNRMDRNKPGERFYTAYAAFGTLLPGASIEPYVMAKTDLGVKGKNGKLGNADGIYGGMRVIGKIRGGFDYNAEAVREGGGYADDTIQAFGYVAGGGWTAAKLPWKPHFNGDYLWASGDDNRKDGHRQMFDCMYGSNQPLNGLTGQFYWRNIAQWRAGAEFTPLKKLLVKIYFRDAWLPTVQDGLYNAFGTRTVYNVKATDNHVGEGVDAMFQYSVNRKTLVGFGVGNLAPGAYLKESGKTTGWIYPYLSFTRML
jgi:hypothetical protein